MQCRIRCLEHPKEDPSKSLGWMRTAERDSPNPSDDFRVSINPCSPPSPPRFIHSRDKRQQQEATLWCFPTASIIYSDTGDLS
jgi:hypothetical protein